MVRWEGASHIDIRELLLFSKGPGSPKLAMVS